MRRAREGGGCLPEGAVRFMRQRWPTWMLFEWVVFGGAAPLGAEQVVTRPYCGVTLIARAETTPRQLSMHLAIIDLRTPGVRFNLTSHSGSLDTVRQSTLDYLRQEHAQVAVNTHFYLPFGTPETNANLVGLAVSEGIVYSPFEGQPIGPDYQDQSHAILPYAPAINIDRSNHAAVVHRDAGYADNLHVQESTTLWTAFSGSAQVVRGGQKTVPAYTGPPDGLTATNGYSDSFSWYEVLRARTVAGLTQDQQTLVLFVVDEAGGSLGMSVAEVADLLIQDYQVYDALNLDGDGSTAMAIEDPTTHDGRLFNTSNDGIEGRVVGSSLAVFAPPAQGSDEMRLAISGSLSNHVLLSWPATPARWELEQAQSFPLPDWRPLEVEPHLAGGCLHVVLPARDDAWLFRLVQKPGIQP